MDKNYYAEKIHEMLNDPAYYEKCEDMNNKEKDIRRQIRNLVTKYNDNLTQNERSYIENFDSKTSNFYGLPKVHKSDIIKKAIHEQNEEYIWIPRPADLKFRPIVAGPVCATSRLSELLDEILKPYLHHVDSYVRDDIDFLNKIPRERDNKRLLVSFDVKSLYSNIPHELGKRAISYWLNKYPDTKTQRFSNDFILEGLSIILENNTFNFDGQGFTQKKGCAMGTKCAPTYANLTLGFLEIELRNLTGQLYGLSYMNKFTSLWKRFLDDCFFTWGGSLEELRTFHLHLNRLDPNIQFEMTYSKEELNFLDLRILQVNGTINIDIYYKETDTHQYLPFNSCHPRHIKTNIPYNQARRICTIVEDPRTRKQRLHELRNFLKDRGYPDSLITSGIQRATNHTQGELRKNKRTKNQDGNKRIFMVSTYNPRNPPIQGKVREAIKCLQMDDHMKHVMSDTEFVISRRQPPNLKKLLTRACFQSETQSNGGSTKCKLPRCKTCEQIIETENINLDTSGTLPQFKIKEAMNCLSKNVIYAMFCRGCGEIYIGSTSNELRRRMTTHRQQIRQPETRQLWVSDHMDKCTKENPKFWVCPFYQMKNNSDIERERKEFFFQRKYRPRLNRNLHD